ncbi:MAG: SgcJ/EcaC family oxidoreductase [Pedosphaera sp.]|nr:SgcJ/EcaC family oxidoreductase [Pedosphaera sp.]
MPDDKQQIRDLIATWLRATAAGDLPQILKLMAEDVVFLLPGQPPMRGRDAFAAGFAAASQRVRIEGTSDVQEIEIAGDWAYCWNRLTVKVTPVSGGSPQLRTGYTLTILRKQPDGNWVVARDANMLTAEASPSA